MVIHHLEDGNISLSWFDGSKVDYKQIFCDDYPLLYTNGTISYTYINVNESCWENTNNMKQSKMVCGPATQQPMLCWISGTIFPAIILFILFILSTYLLYKSWCHLFHKDHNWIYPPSKYAKLSAMTTYSFILIASFFGTISGILDNIGYLKSGFLNEHHFPLDAEYPLIYHISVAFTVILLVGVMIGYSSAYIHILLRLYDFIKQDIIKDVIICKCSLHIIFMMILCLPLLILSFAMMNHNGCCGRSFLNKHKQFIPICIGVDSILINLSLLFFYTRGLYLYAFRVYGNEAMAEKLINTNLVNDRIHELMLEATRYVVLFGGVTIGDIVFIIVGYVGLGYPYPPDGTVECSKSVFIIIGIFVGMKEISILLISIYLSWIFNHDTYLKICGKCHNIVNSICIGCVKRRQRKLIEAAKTEIGLGYTELISNDTFNS